jgi:hypothetical protein
VYLTAALPILAFMECLLWVQYRIARGKPWTDQIMKLIDAGNKEVKKL